MPRARGNAKYQPQPGTPARAGIPLPLLIGVIAIVVVGFALLRREHGAADQERREAERAAQQERDARARVGEEPFTTPGENWPKILGSWRRETTGPGDTATPYRFQFFQNLSANVTQLQPDGSVVSRFYHLDIFADESDRIVLRFRDGHSIFTFQFTLKSDRTIALRNGAEELIFSRP